MKIHFSCLPGYEERLPKPSLARGCLPSWLRAMPAQAASQILAGASVRTVKQCPPFVDAMQSGILFPLAADLHMRDGNLTWDWDLPVHRDGRMTRSPIGVHLPEQIAGLPGASTKYFVVKFTNFWTVELPEGWSMLFGHPANRADLPFRTLTGLVDCDRWCDGFVHFPGIWVEPDFEGTLPAGTPVAQAWPIRREEIELEFSAMNAQGLARHLRLQDGLEKQPGLYRKAYRSGVA